LIYRYLSLVLGLLLSNIALAAETGAITNYSPDQLEYYLFQAFNAPFQQDRQALNHIGIQGQVTERGFLVSAVLQGYPAHEAGINRGDIILSANGSPFHPVFSFNQSTQALDVLSPQMGTFDLEVSRADQTRRISLSPRFENLYDSYRNATLNSVQEFSSGNKVIGYVQIWALARSSDSLLSLQQLIASLDHCDGIIVDLRGSYGFLDWQHFTLFNPGKPDITMADAPAWLGSWQSSSLAMAAETYRKPLVLLIDSSTRGAAEILTLALDDAERISSMGTRTAGMVGSMELRQDSLNYLPATELMIGEQTLEGTGVAPEQKVDYPFDESRRDDPQFETAVTWLLGVI